MKIIQFALLSGIILLTSCKSVKMDSPEVATKLVEFSKSACYGDCPAYHIVVNTDGSVIYTGKRKVERMGTYTSQLDKKAYIDLYKSLESADLYALEDKYNEDVSDGSVTRVTYFGEKGMKKIKTVYSFPGQLQSVSDKLQGIAEKKSGWKMVKEAGVPKKDIIKDDRPTQKVFSYNQGACFGQCPVFSLNIYSDKSMVLIGERHTEKMGIYEKTLGSKEYEALMELFSGDEFLGLDEYYDMDIMDAQTFVLEYYDENRKMKKVSTKITKSPVVETLIEIMQDFEAEKGWSKKEGKGEVLPKNTILISLSPKVEAKTWIRTKRHLGAKIVRFLSPNGTYFIISVDEDKEIDRVMEELRRDKYVLAVEPGDRPAKPRTGKPKGSKPNKHGKATIKRGGK